MSSCIASRYAASGENVEFDFLAAMDVENRSVEHAMRELNRGMRARAQGEEEALRYSAFGGLCYILPSGMLSTVVHVVVLLTGALWFLPPVADNSAPPLVITDPEQIEESKEIFEEEFILQDEPTEEEMLDEIDLSEDIPTADQKIESQFTELEAREATTTLDMIQIDTLLPVIEHLREFSTTHSGGTAFSGRGRMQRAAIVRKQGGDTITERAVEDALKWIARHQNRADGGFSFNHKQGVAGCTCTNPGSHGRNGATGLALLPFLGAGYTHQEGPYKKQIGHALGFLIRRMKPDAKSRGGSLWEAQGKMYSHGICAIALAEAYGMTRDSRLRAPTIAALRYIIYAQDPKGGGWRYNPRQAGDTSVVGWQLMALKSGKMAGLEVPPFVFHKANQFLKSVSAESGTWYGYADASKAKGRYATTAVGHLSRMYMGAGRDDPSLQRGVAVMDKKGPDWSNMYYSYYASQVIHHYGGEPWQRWNKRMRDGLLDKQAKKGHQKGSWAFSGGDHGYKAGGRLYMTAMACMMLEVYYRHMPLYQDNTAERAALDGWDLE